MKCRKCGKGLPKTGITDICLECSRENVRQIFKENPEVKQAFKESVEDMRRPENMKKMVANTVKFMRGLQTLQEQRRKD